MPGLLIPDDWDELNDGFCTLTVTVPNSPLWRANVRGALHALSHAQQWDAETGDPDQAASLGQDMFESIAFDCP